MPGCGRSSTGRASGWSSCAPRQAAPRPTRAPTLPPEQPSRRWLEPVQPRRAAASHPAVVNCPLCTTTLRRAAQHPPRSATGRGCVQHHDQLCALCRQALSVKVCALAHPLSSATQQRHSPAAVGSSPLRQHASALRSQKKLAMPPAAPVTHPRRALQGQLSEAAGAQPLSNVAANVASAADWHAGWAGPHLHASSSHEQRSCQARSDQSGNSDLHYVQTWQQQVRSSAGCNIHC